MNRMKRMKGTGSSRIKPAEWRVQFARRTAPRIHDRRCTEIKRSDFTTTGECDPARRRRLRNENERTPAGRWSSSRCGNSATNMGGNRKRTPPNKATIVPECDDQDNQKKKKAIALPVIFAPCLANRPRAVIADDRRNRDVKNETAALT